MQCLARALLVGSLLVGSAALRPTGRLPGRRATLHGAVAVAGGASATALCPLGAAAAAAATVPAAPAGKKLSRAAIEGKLRRIPVCALVNADDEPFLSGGGGVGFFFLDPQEALLALRVLQQTRPEARIKSVPLTDVYFPLVREPLTDLGGTLLLRPSRRDVVMANRALQFNQPVGSNKLLPTSLDEAKGQVPVFYSEQVALVDPKSGETSYPFFLSKADLDAAFLELQTGKAQADDGAAAPAKGAKRSGQGTSGATEMPVGQVRIATLDGLVDQMVNGEAVDLSQAVVVGSRTALRLSQRLAEEEKGEPVVEATR